MTDRSDQTNVLDGFSDNLDRWGTNLDDWPPAEAASARTLLAASAQAQAEFALADKLQGLLRALPVPSAPATLTAQIASRAPEDFWQQLSAWFTASLWRPVLAGSLPLVVGFALGFTMTLNMEDEMADEIRLLALTTSFEEFNYDL